MSTVATKKITVDEYHEMIRTGQLTTEDRVELLEGVLVPKMPQYPPHATSISLVEIALSVLTKGWYFRTQRPITLSDSEPEPDLAIVKGSVRDYTSRHPVPRDVAIVIEVADSSLDFDRLDKGRLYARGGIREYWIVNLVDDQVEVYTQPLGVEPNPHFTNRQDYPRNSAVPLTIDGHNVANLPVNDLLP